MNAAAPLDAAAPLNSTAPLVGIAMGSASDLATLKPAADILERFGIEYDLRVLSAHRTPRAMAEYARTAASRGLKVLIAGAGGAAHLPGMLAANTPLPVIGVPVPGSQLNGLDSLLSIVQMPRGVPVATVAVGGGANAGILAVQILACSDPALLQRVVDFKEELADLARQQDAEINRPHL